MDTRGLAAPSNKTMANYSQAESSVYQVLAQANLLRVRGLWDDAVERCMAAMKLDPDNVSVLSLLGDIYENQGKLTEAIQWYRLALDKNPESPADRLKLKSALSMLEHNAVAQAPELLAAKVATWSSETPTPERAHTHSPAFNHNVLTITLRIAAYGLALAFAIIVGYGLSSTSPRAVRTRSANSNNFESDPILVQSDGPASSTFLTNSRDSSELNLLNTLAADPQLTGNGVSVADVSDDPRFGLITVTALYTSTDTSFNGKSDILRAALRTALETSSHTDGVSATSFTIRILVSNPTTGADKLTFTGDITRAAISVIPADPATIPDGQLLAKFDNPWWDPGFTG